MPIRLGFGLPNTLPGADRDLVLNWAREVEDGPFTSLAVLDRLRYGSLEAMLTLAAAAAVTTRIRLATMILIGPLRNTALLAKQTATLDVISGGRLTLGLAIGARKDDYEAAGVDFAARGDRLDQQLADLRTMWEGDEIGPKPVQPGGPPILIGGTTDAVFARASRWAEGYAHGGGPPRAFATAAQKARAAWVDSGRPGQPALWGQGYYALGEGTADAGMDYLRDYYAFTGPFAERIAQGLLTTPQAVMAFVRGYQDAGCDELVLFPAVARADQVERLKDVVG